MICWKKAGVY